MSGDSDEITILLVDDLPENLLALEAALDGCGYTLLRATSGEETLRLVMKHDVDLILLDVQMPGMDGFETAQLIHGKKGFRNIPIIFLTAISKEPQYVRQGYEVGAENYLFKPIDPEDLQRKVHIVLQQKKYEKQLQALKQKKASTPIP
jgi:CheY-like chemotaxis protein